ncbi:hypothetical protein CGC56_01940 [Capnocytophaga canimorsus]|nr:Hypothetical protein Ccan_12540 [Capnocytophaga canimorsus Cc5]ATA91036.1 hypothetical protein CGC56_01940 [Capnocytophaga canimorsus]
MRNGAVVEPDEVLKMRKSTDKLADDLRKTSKELINSTEQLNNNGFQDANFDRLYQVITENKKHLEELDKVMLDFSKYLKFIEENIRELIEGDPFKKSNITVR